MEKKGIMIVYYINLPSGGKPPATDDDEGLLEFRDSKFDRDSTSGVVNLWLPPLS